VTGSPENGCICWEWLKPVRVGEKMLETKSVMVDMSERKGVAAISKQSAVK